MFNPSVLSKPRSLLLINDQSVNFTECMITNNNNYVADTFLVYIPMDYQLEHFSDNFWANEDVMTVEFFIGVPPDANSFSRDDLQDVFYGDGEVLDIDLINRNIVLSGRNLIGRLLDQKINLDIVSHTSSQIVTELAHQNDLKTQVTRTTTPIGTYFDNQHVTISSFVSQWDLLIYLAQQENFSLFIEAQTLYFQPRNTQNIKPYQLPYQKLSPLPQSIIKSNATALKVRRNLTLARDITVEVQGFDDNEGKSYTQKALTQRRSGTYRRKQNFVFNVEGLTAAQAQQYAQSQLQQISANELIIEGTIPGTNQLKINTPIQLTGAADNFNTTYYLDSITRHFSWDRGYEIDIRAKNHSPLTQVVLPT